MLLASCLNSDDEEIILYDDAAITGFTLGNLTQKNPSTGVSTILAGSVYKMGIDQINFKIYNRDSLPVGTDVSSVTVTVTTSNGSAVTVRSLQDSTRYEYYGTTLAVDFTVPRIFRVYASDGSYHRDYEVTLNVKNAQATDFWTARADTTLLAGFDHMRILSVDTTLVVFGAKSDSTTICTSLDGGNTWTEESTKLDADAWKSAVVRGDSIYTLSNNQLFFSKDGKQWSSLPNSWNLKQLVGAGTKELFALTTDSTLKASMNSLDQWTDEVIDGNVDADSVKNWLMLDAVSSVSFPYTSMANTDYVLMAGNNGTRSVVWRKISSYGTPGNTGKWVCIPAESINNYLLPLQSRLSLVYQNGSVLAVGQSTPVYVSADQGITWRVNTSYTLPIEMQSATADANGVIWGVSADGATGKVWRGNLY